ncbi:MAG: ATP-binding protein, partial [Promethearchaeota archaeon]
SINKDLLDQLPALAQRTALIFGDCVRSPAQIYMNEANPRPDSLDPKFMEHWLDDSSNEPDFERICAEWEGIEGTGDE